MVARGNHTDGICRARLTVGLIATRTYRCGLSAFSGVRLSALDRLLAPAPADKWALWCDQLGYEAPLLGPTPPPAAISCPRGHIVDGSDGNEHPLLPDGSCTACHNHDLLAKRGAA
jgi:hypothetical protein